jgi:hypothetical protein
MNEEFFEEIEKWKSKIDLGEEILYEIAFFKIFVKFEQSLANLFIKYSTEGKSLDGLVLKRRLEFEDEKHFNDFLKNPNSSYIDYLEKVSYMPKLIFEDNFNIFDLALNDSEFSQTYTKMITLRNYIAHESKESKQKYIKCNLSNNNFIEPYEYLKKVVRNRQKSNYSIFVENMKKTIDILVGAKVYLTEIE